MRRGFESLYPCHINLIDFYLEEQCRGVAQFGSALGLGPWGRGFESLHLDQITVGIAQLVRAPDCGSGGREFESHYPPHTKYDSLAQSVEHLTFNQGVRSSNLRWVTNKKGDMTKWLR